MMNTASAEFESKYAGSPNLRGEPPDLPGIVIKENKSSLGKLCDDVKTLSMEISPDSREASYPIDISIQFSRNKNPKPLLDNRNEAGMSNHKSDILDKMPSDSTEFNYLDGSFECCTKKKPKHLRKTCEDLEGAEMSKNKRDSLDELPSDSTEVDYLSVNFDFSKKKKKKSKHLRRIQEDIDEAEMSKKKMSVSTETPPLEDSDYSYEYLLNLCFNLAESQGHSSAMNSSMKITLQVPETLRLGTKKTVFVNLIDICRSLHRTPKHVISFILAELGTSGSIDGNNHLVIRGRFQPNQIANILRRYVMEYVRCATCNSMNTIMQKRIRLDFLICENCNSQRSVANVKSGFQALTVKRAAMRAKRSA